MTVQWRQWVTPCFDSWQQNFRRGHHIHPLSGHRAAWPLITHWMCGPLRWAKVAEAFNLYSFLSSFLDKGAILPSPLILCNSSYVLTPWCRVLLEKLTGLQLVKNFHGTRRFITALTSVRHLSLSWASPIQSIYSHPTSWTSILILSTHLRLGLPSGLLHSGFPHQDPIHPPLLTHTRHMPSPTHSSRFYHPHNIWWGVQII